MDNQPSEHTSMLGQMGEVRDKWNYVYWTNFYIGLATLFPWNMVISITSYWNYKLRNVNETITGDQLTDLQKIYNSYLSIAANVPNALLLILTAFFGHKFSTKWQVFGSQIFISIGLVGVAIFALLNTDSYQKMFLNINLVLFAVVSGVNGVYQGSAGAMMGKMPVKIIGAAPTGAGLGGLIPALLNILIIWLSSDPETTGFICFLVASIVNLVAAFLVIGLLRNPFFLSKKTSLTLEQSRTEDLAAKYLDIVKHSWLFITSILIVFTTTLIAFPSVTALIVPMDSPNDDWANLYFVPVCCFINFNFFDFIGKDVATKVQLPGPSRKGQLTLLTLCILRIGFIPLLMFCNVGPNVRTLPVIFESEWWYIVFISLFGFSNGYLGNIGFMFGPKVVSEDNQEMAAAFGVSALVIGCGIGSLISTPVVNAL